MHRRTILRLITSTTAITGCCVGIWFMQGWSDSGPRGATQAAGTVSENSVKGVSSEETSQPLAAYPVLPAGVPAVTPYAKQYALYHLESGKLLLTSSSLETVPIASTTKLMTAYLAAIHADPEETATVSALAAGQIPSSMGLVAGETATIRTLLTGALLVSGNDAAFTLAEHVGGKLLGNQEATSEAKVARFVEEMNSTAKQFHLEHTNYRDPAGLDDGGHSNAAELARITGLASQSELLSGIMRTATLTVADVSGRYRHDLRNSNRFVTDYFYSDVIAGKTGLTDGAGHCLTVAVQRSGNTLIAVVLNTNSQSKEASAQEARKLIDFGFQYVRFE